MVAIGDLLSLWHDPSRQSADVKRVAQQHLTELSSRIKKHAGHGLGAGSIHWLLSG